MKAMILILFYCLLYVSLIGIEVRSYIICEGNVARTHCEFVNFMLSVPLSVDGEHEFYSIGLSQVANNSVPCRTLR